MELLDDNGNNLLHDIDCANLQDELINHMVNDIESKRISIIKERLKEIVGIEIDVDSEQKRRFKRLQMERNGDEETVYFNDGSVEGKRIVTFVRKQKPFNPEDFSISIEYNYY